MKSEKKTYKDPCSGVRVTQLTDYKGHSHHLYFTNPGWYAEGTTLLFSSDRNNRTNLYGLDIRTGEIEQLTDLSPLPPPHEVVFLSACKNPVREEVYFWYGLELWALDIESLATRVLYELEPKWQISMTNCAADGEHIYFGCFEDLSARIHTDLLRGYVGFAEINEARPESRIVQVSVRTGDSRVVHQEKYWIGHVNTSPTQRNLLTFCHEGPWDKVDHRIWGLDADTCRSWRIRPQAEGETIGHEYWYADGIHVGYHGRGADEMPLLGSITFDGKDQREARFPGHTGHIFSHDENLIVGDGNGVIRVWQLRDGEYTLPRVLCRHDSSMNIQQTHPHPRISPDGEYVVFTSDRSGYGNVYTVPMVDVERLPLTDESR
jgi:oligogalacturonide lyase